MTRALVRRIAILALALVFLAPLVTTAEVRPVTSLWEAAPTPVTLLARLWATFLTAASTKAGCTLDPSGSPRCTASRPEGEAGCTLDPDGACVKVD
jgi:hypothetical protein